MAISIVASTKQPGTSSSSSVVTSAIDTTGSSLILVLVVDFGFNSSTVAPTDNQGNTWTLYDNFTAGNNGGAIFYALNPNTNASHTFTSGVGNFRSIVVLALAGTDTTSPFDQYAENGPLGNNPQFGSVTPSQDDELVVSVLSTFETGSPWTINSSFTIAQQQVSIGSQAMGGAIATKLQTTAGAENPTWTSNFVSVSGANFTIFAAAASGTDYPEDLDFDITVGATFAGINAFAESLTFAMEVDYLMGFGWLDTLLFAVELDKALMDQGGFGASLSFGLTLDFQQSTHLAAVAAMNQSALLLGATHTGSTGREEAVSFDVELDALLVGSRGYADALAFALEVDQAFSNTLQAVGVLAFAIAAGYDLSNQVDLQEDMTAGLDLTFSATSKIDAVETLAAALALTAAMTGSAGYPLTLDSMGIALGLAISSQRAVTGPGIFGPETSGTPGIFNEPEDSPPAPGGRRQSSDDVPPGIFNE